MGKIKVGVVGCGGRGRGLMADCFVYIKDMEVVAVCDNFEDRADTTAAMLREKTEYNDVPESFKGTPIVLLTAALMSIAFFGFAGLI